MEIYIDYIIFYLTKNNPLLIFPWFVIISQLRSSDFYYSDGGKRPKYKQMIIFKKIIK